MNKTDIELQLAYNKGRDTETLYCEERFLNLIDKLKAELLADKENPVSGVGALQLLEQRL